MSSLNLLEKLLSKTDAACLSEKLQQQGKKVVFTNGCFDLLHAGHIQYLTEAKACGDVLILGLNSDSSVQKLKGHSRPLNNQEDRAIVVSGLSTVDWVVIFEEDTPISLLGAIKPNIHVKGGDYQVEKLPEYPVVKSYGGEVKILSFRTGHSTTSLVNKILDSR